MGHTDLGFSEFQVGKDHPDYVMSQHKYMNLAMKKPRFSHLKRKFLKKKSNKKTHTNTNYRANVTGIEEEKDGGNNDAVYEPQADD